MLLTKILIQAGTSVGIGFGLLLILIIIVLISKANIYDSHVEAILSICYILLAPFFEEVFFRAPLLFFNRFSITSIIISIVISCYFGYIHRNNKEKRIKRTNSNYKSSLLSKSFTVCITGSIGLILSIITIKTQSIFYPVIIHFIYNLAVLIIAAIITIYKVRERTK